MYEPVVYEGVMPDVTKGVCVHLLSLRLYVCT